MWWLKFIWDSKRRHLQNLCNFPYFKIWILVVAVEPRPTPHNGIEEWMSEREVFKILRTKDKTSSDQGKGPHGTTTTLRISKNSIPSSWGFGDCGSRWRLCGFNVCGSKIRSPENSPNPPYPLAGDDTGRSGHVRGRRVFRSPTTVFMVENVRKCTAAETRNNW